MLLGRQGRPGHLGAAYCLTLLSETRRKFPGKRPAGGQRTCCWAAKGAGGHLGAAYCLTMLSETRRKSPGKRPAGGQRTCCWAAKGTGGHLGAAYCLTSLSKNQKKISRKAPGRWPKDMLLGRQGRRETFRGSLPPNVAF